MTVFRKNEILLHSLVARRKSFELFRNNLGNVLVITFDELLHKLKALYEFLQANPIEGASELDPETADFGDGELFPEDVDYEDVDYENGDYEDLLGFGNVDD